MIVLYLIFGGITYSYITDLMASLELTEWEGFIVYLSVYGIIMIGAIAIIRIIALEKRMSELETRVEKLEKQPDDKKE